MVCSVFLREGGKPAAKGSLCPVHTACSTTFFECSGGIRPRADESDEVVIARRPHPFPSRTRPLSSAAPMVLLCGRVGHRLVFLFPSLPASSDGGFFVWGGLCDTGSAHVVCTIGSVACDPGRACTLGCPTG